MHRMRRSVLVWSGAAAAGAIACVVQVAYLKPENLVELMQLLVLCR